MLIFTLNWMKNKMKRIKIKEFKIFSKIFNEHKYSPEYKAKEVKRKIKEKLEQQKKFHALLKIIWKFITIRQWWWKEKTFIDLY